MKSIYVVPFIIVTAFSACKSGSEIQDSPPKRVIIGYVPGYNGELTSTIDARKLTHINYAFVNVKDSVALLSNLATDTINFRKLNALKKENPDLKILISLGGWSWSENFSDAVLTPSSRKKFAESGVQMIRDYQLDGIDIDWEYPGFPGEDNIYRLEDRQNFTLMFKALREELDALTKSTGKVYLLTTAVPEFKKFLDKTDMQEVAKYLDYVNLMTYDFHTGASDTVGHHSNLYPSRTSQRSAHRGITDFLAAGVPAEKIVVGLPFYGRSWIMPDSLDHGIERIAKSVAKSGGYTFIRDSLVNRNGFRRYWDTDAQAPYLFNGETNQLVVYDDEESVKIKCEYVLKNKLGGVMFWEYEDDPKLYLLNAINEHLAK
jgi:chitinase